MTAEARTVLLRDLANLVANHPADPEIANLEVVRLLHRGDISWSDLLGPAEAGDDYLVQLLTYGYARTPIELGRVMLRLVSVAGPLRLAEAAILLQGNVSLEQQERLTVLANEALALSMPGSGS